MSPRVTRVLRAKPARVGARPGRVEFGVSLLLISPPRTSRTQRASPQPAWETAAPTVGPAAHSQRGPWKRCWVPAGAPVAITLTLAPGRTSLCPGMDTTRAHARPHWRPHSRAYSCPLPSKVHAQPCAAAAPRVTLPAHPRAIAVGGLGREQLKFPYNFL